MRIDDNILQRVENIKWFANCGNRIDENFSINFSYAKDWEDAKSSCKNSTWENTSMEARNILSSFLHKRYLSQYSNWNKISKEARAFVNSKVEHQLIGLIENYSIDEKIIQIIKWDLLNAIIEHSYKDCKNRPTFFLYLLDVYEQGNFPCGWRGSYPNGELIVY
ncbi:hypothetical protein [Brevibacillus sp. SYSU BS000544]|uniref:hypothetical protein n=1 Tax=Brevibacillus sp. SYSU BS000544 TaxID=3416443 RepID=UPI003CE4D0D2